MGISMYIIELKGKKYFVEVSDSAATIEHIEDLDSLEDDFDERIDPDTIPDLFNEITAINETKPSIITASLPGMVIEIGVKEGELVKKNNPLLILETMKMENEISSSVTGVIEKIFVKKGDKISKGQKLLSISPGY